MAERIYTKLQTIADNVQKVYNSGYKAGALQGVQTQEKTVAPSAEIQEVLPDDGYALSKVTVGAVDKPFVDTSKITNFAYFFYQGLRMEIIDKVQFQGYQFTNAFNGNTAITKLPQGVLDITNSAMDGTSMCLNATNLTEVITEKWRGMNFNTTFKGCTALTEVYAPNCNVNNAPSAFENCTSLESVVLGSCVSWISSMSNMFNNCKNIKTIIIKDIRKALQIGSGSTWGHLLTVESLINTIKELVNTGSALTLTMGSVNKAKIADVWCIVTDNTTTKMSIEIVDAGTEGAMTLENFARLKGWSIT